MQKNHFLLLLFSILFFSCTKEKITKTTINSKKKISGIVLPNGGIDPSDLVGYGYDLTGPLLDNDNSSDTRVIDMNRFLADHPDKIFTPTHTEGTQQFYYGYDAYNYLSDLTKKITSKGNIGGLPNPQKNVFSGTFGFNNSSQDRYTFSSKYSYSTFESIHRLKRIKIVDAVDIALLRQYLSTTFIQAVNTLSPLDLIKRYGTHVLVDISVGGRLSFNFKSSVVEQDDYEKKTRTVSAGITLALKNLSVGFSGESTKEEVIEYGNDNKEISFDLTYKGGTNSGTSISLNPEGSNVNLNIAQWQSSINEQNSVLTDINKAIPIYEFISDPQKKNEVQTAVVKYIDDSQIKVLDLKTLYRMHSDNSGNTFFVFSKNEVNEYSSLYGDRFLGIDGYVLRNQEPNTKTLYKLHSNKSGNTFYVFSQAEVNEYVTRWKDVYRGIDGYIFNSPQPNTKPLYRMHSKRSSNTFYLYDMADVYKYMADWGDEYRGIDGYIYN